MKKVNLFLLTMIIMFMGAAGCSNSSEVREEPTELPMLNVYMTNGYRYNPIRILEDETFRKELEKTVGARICLHYRDQNQDAGLLNSESVSGVILSDVPTAIQILADHAKISQMDPEAMRREGSSFGRYLGVQYGFVFTNGDHPVQPILLAAADKLDAAEIHDIPYTTEGWTEILKRLKEVCSEPLALYGSPVDPSYAPLLALFGLTPQGGYEFRFDSGKTEYDKLSESGQDYLRFLNDLYREDYLPKDMLSMNLYSAGYKMLKNVSALMVFYDEDYLRTFLDSAESSDIRIVRVDLPVSGKLIETGTDRRFYGLITADCPDKDLAYNFLETLDKMAQALSLPEYPVKLDAYELFTDTLEDSRDLFDDLQVPEINILYQSLKNTLDSESIIPYYSQIAVGEKPLGSFSTMISLWLESQVSMMNSTFYGTHILNYYRK